MEKPAYKGNGRLTTRLLGRLEVYHGDGIIEFRLRSESEIRKRGVRTILRIEGMPEIPRIEHGKMITVDLLSHKNNLPCVFVGEEPKDEANTLHRNRREDSKGDPR